MKAATEKQMTKIQGVPWVLRLFVAANSAASQAAITHSRYLLAEHLPEGSKLEVIDIESEFGAASREQVLAIPTLVRVTPHPMRRIIGDLADTEKVLTALGVAR